MIKNNIPYTIKWVMNNKEHHQYIEFEGKKYYIKKIDIVTEIDPITGITTSTNTIVFKKKSSKKILFTKFEKETTYTTNDL